ncbi:hypothetical protein OKA05_04485 [Luteolibacter arcticus]|uniref:Uncharacterized protein n=1 Tax=Luteolibacter arcticus TaxID=1581411 RepID=A0ABT3GDU2_9BACT|nr:hypothetical protein [Luteolibacter arcticus]MCW1921797.1 hypothetical protein [Luteolibacter arcticus]
MKILLPLLLLFPVLLAAEEEKLAELVTRDAKLYTGVTIRKVEPDGLSILHDSGTAKIPFEMLSKDLQTKYGYDKATAAEHQERLAEAQRQRDAADRAANKKQKDAAATHAAAEADKAFAEKVQKAAMMVSVEAFQNARSGLIGDIREGTLTTEPVKSKMGSTVGQKPVWVYRNRAIGGIVAGTKGAKAGVHVDSDGYGETLITWEGKAWRIGKIAYVNRQGLVVTTPLYTASEKEAATFYKKNGFGPKSDDVTRRAH